MLLMLLLLMLLLLLLRSISKMFLLNRESFKRRKRRRCFFSLISALAAAAAAGSLHSSVALFLHLLALQLLSRFLFLRLRFIVVAAFNNDIILFRENKLDVTRRGHVGVDAPVGAVRTTPHLSSAIHLDVGDDEVV